MAKNNLKKTKQDKTKKILNVKTTSQNTTALVVTKWSYTITGKYMETVLCTGQSKSGSYIQCKKVL